MGASDKYYDALKNIPAPGCGCHAFLLTVANHGVMAELNAEQIFQDLRKSIPQGTRRIPDREIQDAINKALSDRNGGTFTPRPRPEPIIKDGAAALRRVIEKATITSEVDLWEVSPIRLWEAP